MLNSFQHRIGVQSCDPESSSGRRILIATRYKKNNKIQFSGWQNLERKCLGVVDLDNTLTLGTAEEIKQILQTISQRNGKKVYATGNSLEQFLAIQKKLANSGIDLPTPEDLIANNGQYVYENINEILVKDTQYEAMLKNKTNFDSEKVFEKLRIHAKLPKYKFSEQEYANLTKLDNFEEIKASDPEFYDSKITRYLWSPSEFMSEYFVAAGVNVNRLKKEIRQELGTIGMKTKFIEQLFPKNIMDKCRPDILLQSNPLRRHTEGEMTALFLCPADKADGVEYLKRKLNILYKEILMAGDDDNDISLAKLAKMGAHFIAVNNSSPRLKAFCNNTNNPSGSIFMSQYQGAKGIIEGINKLINH